MGMLHFSIRPEDATQSEPLWGQWGGGGGGGGAEREERVCGWFHWSKASDRQSSRPEGRCVGERMRASTELVSWLGEQCLGGASGGGAGFGQSGSPRC